MIQLNLFTKQKETHRFWKQVYGYQREKLGRKKNGEYVYICVCVCIYKVHKQQGLTAQLRELYSISNNSL